MLDNIRITIIVNASNECEQHDVFSSRKIAAVRR